MLLSHGFVGSAHRTVVQRVRVLINFNKSQYLLLPINTLTNITETESLYNRFVAIECLSASIASSDVKLTLGTAMVRRYVTLICDLDIRS